MTAQADGAALFPSIGRRRRKWPRRAALAVAVVAVAVLIGGLVMSASGSSPQYRTVAVSQRDVQAVLQGVGTIEPVTQAAVAFPVAGTVAAVNVNVGDTVAVGQALAALDVSALTASLHQQQAALDQANVTLQKALAGQSVPAPTATQTAARTGPVTATLLAAVTSAVDPDVAAAEQAVVTAQKNVDAASDKAAAALASAKSVCAAVGQGTGTDPSGVTSAVNACQTALQAVIDAQAAVTSAQDDLAKASKTLDDLLTKIANTPPPTTTPPTTTPPTTEPPTTTPPSTSPPVSTSPPTTTAPPPAGGGTPPTTAPTPATSTPDTSTSVPSGPSGARTGGGGGGRGGGGSFAGSSGSAARASGSAAKAPSAADLAAYQSAVDAAQAGVTVAQQAIDQATIVSPIAGTVLAVNLTAGQAAQAGSTTQTILVLGGGGLEAMTSVSLADVPKVKVGQAATVTPDGAAQPVTGSVVSVAAMPNAANTSTTTYNVIVSLPSDSSALTNGAIGTVGIVTGTASGIAVPSSAVRTTAGRRTVTVLEGNTTRTVAVQVGVVGDQWTQITNGLSAGQLVVLATVSDPLPSSATATTTANNAANRGRGAFVFPGGALPGRD
jgi:multidrug efflux pump subunit AcrA (membrane-fusion protein)